MASFQIDLPDKLAADAASAGLLTSEQIAELIEAKLKKQARDRLSAMIKDIHSVSGSPMSMDEINAEVKASRRERQEAKAGR